MVTETDMKDMIKRWKRGTHALRIHEQHHGEHLVSLLERYQGPGLRLFDDYLEAATFVLLVGIVKELDNRKREFDEMELPPG